MTPESCFAGVGQSAQCLHALTAGLCGRVGAKVLQLEVHLYASAGKVYTYCALSVGVELIFGEPREQIAFA